MRNLSSGAISSLYHDKKRSFFAEMKPIETGWLSRKKSLAPDIALIRAFELWFFVDYLKALGSPVDPLLQKAGIPVYALEEPLAPVPLQMARKFMQMAADQEDIPHLGLLVGTGVTLRDFGAYGQLLSRSLNFHDYLITGVKHYRMLNSGAHFWVHTGVDEVRIGYHRSGGNSPETMHDDLFSLMATISLIRQATRSHWTPTLLRLPHSSPQLLARLRTDEAIGGIQIVADAGDPCLVFPISDLDLPVAQTPRQEDHQDPVTLPPTTLPTELDQSLRLLLQSLMREGYPRIERVAAMAGTSKRSLQRYLSDLDLSYSDLVEQVRLATAVRLLTTTDQPVDAIAYSLGYTDPANFSRAFRRWLGRAPRHFRQQTRSCAVTVQGAPQ